MESVLICVVIVFVCLMLSLPIGVSLGLGTAVAMATAATTPTILVAQKAFSGLDSFPLMAVPFFMPDDYRRYCPPHRACGRPVGR